jgi:hypothetical protein
MVTYISSLDKVASNKQVLLVGRDLDVMRSDDGLLLIGVIEALDVVEVGNVESSDVVAKSDGEVGELAVIGDVRVDGNRVLGLVTEIVEKLSDTLVALGVLAEGVDNPDLARTDSTASRSVSFIMLKLVQRGLTLQ